MREYQIKIEPFQYIALQELTIRSAVNDHAKASVTMRIKDSNREQYMSLLMKQTWVKIIGVGEQSGGTELRTILFCGMVTDFTFSQDGYETILKLQITSGTVMMDLKPHFRVFQNKDAKCADIYAKLTGSYQNGQVTCAEGAENRTQGVLIQYQETDWEFLKRVAGRKGLYLIPDTLKNGVKYTVGLPAGTKMTIDMNRIRIKLDVNEYLQKSRNGMTSLQAADMTELIMEDREIHQIGDSIVYQNKAYFIWQILTRYDGAECVHTYYFRTKEAVRTLPMTHPAIVGCSFDAVITDVRQDKVRVEIKQDEWQAADGKKWFLYSTVYSSADGTGWYCMPEIGDSVRMYVPEMEEDSFIISAVHKETDRARQNPDYKSFKTKYDKEILFTPDSILMTNNKGMMVEMNDSEGITITSDKDIVIEAEDSLTISSGNASLLIAANDILQVKQGGTSMTLNKDIAFTGGEFRIQ